jgi:hypothetical protein
VCQHAPLPHTKSILHACHVPQGVSVALLPLALPVAQIGTFSVLNAIAIATLFPNNTMYPKSDVSFVQLDATPALAVAALLV